MAISNTPNTTEYMVNDTVAYDQFGTEVPAYPTVTTSQPPTYGWSVWCQTCLASFPYPHTCPSVNVDISKQYPTLSLETRILQLEARILDLQDFISQLTNRIEALENK